MPSATASSSQTPAEPDSVVNARLVDDLKYDILRLGLVSPSHLELDTGRDPRFAYNR